MTAALLILTLLPSPLIGRLDDPRYRTRAAAHAALARLGRFAVPALAKAAASHPDPEVRARAAVLLRPYAEELAAREADRLIGPDCPRIPVGWQAGPGHTEALREVYRRRGFVGSDSPPWYTYAPAEDRRLATHFWARSQLLQRRPRGEIARGIREMR